MLEAATHISHRAEYTLFLGHSLSHCHVLHPHPNP